MHERRLWRDGMLQVPLHVHMCAWDPRTMQSDVIKDETICPSVGPPLYTCTHPYGTRCGNLSRHTTLDWPFHIVLASMIQSSDPDP